jgi:predicted AAA+ superfamily ATPase
VALSNRERVGKAFELLAAGLGPWVDRKMRARSPLGEAWFADWRQRERGDVSLADPALQLKVVSDAWDVAFRDELTRSDRNAVFVIRDMRNKWAHNSSFSYDETYRCLDNIELLLAAIDATEASEVGRAKADLGRLRYEAEARKATPTQEALLNAPTAGLKPWREVIVPHDDVARGRFALAEFAADLNQVALGEGSPEYVDPVEFFRRTYLTQGLRTLLVEAVERMRGEGGVPVVDLQTNFGGGKTHSQIALWHLFSATPLLAWPQDLQDLLRRLEVTDLPPVRRAALVGTKLSPGQPATKADGTVVRTLWGELAWQLGGAEGFAMVAGADRTATNPGDALRDLLARYAPCLILIDEWVAYARQLIGAEGLPGGSFETHFSFAQALTESVRSVPAAMLVVSLPASEGIGSRVGSDVELGGPGGKEALERLRNVVGRMESSWRPSSASESFEIVRRRLFKPIEPDAVAHRDATAAAFGDLYRRQGAEFPPGCKEAAYVDRIKAAFPIHPELFARLYEDWSTLERFQRTRGVLRLLALVIHALWESGDQAPLIMPASVALAESDAGTELAHHLEDTWKPILDADVDGPGSVPVTLDQELAGTLGRVQAARRVARTVFLASAPLARSANRGVDVARIRLGCVLPGETIATFGDALARMTGRSTYLYADGGRYWYGLAPSVARLARDRAWALLRDRLDEVHGEIVRLVGEAARDRGPFAAVHPAPPGPGDVPDAPEARLVILGPEHPHVGRAGDSSALTQARSILERRGSGARDYRNMVVFLASDHRRLEELQAGVADQLAWASIDDEAGAEGLGLDLAQANQATTNRRTAERVTRLRLAETYQWLLVPAQPDPLGAVGFDAVRVEGQDSLAVRAGNKLEGGAYLYRIYAPALLRRRLDQELAILWQDGHVEVRTVWESFARYPYLPRLRDQAVLVASAGDGPASTDWAREGFATADGFDDQTGRYLGLTVGAQAAASPTTLLVRPDRAQAQQAAEAEARQTSGVSPAGVLPGEGSPSPADTTAAVPAAEVGGPQGPRRFHASICLDPARITRDFNRAVEEVLSHLAGQLGTHVEIVVDVSATNDEGFSAQVVRTVSENARTLRFDDADFESR